MKIDKKIIKELSDYLDEFNLTELEYTEKDTKIKVSKNNVSITNQPSVLTITKYLLNQLQQQIIKSQVKKLLRQLLVPLIMHLNQVLKNLLK